MKRPVPDQPWQDALIIAAYVAVVVLGLLLGTSVLLSCATARPLRLAPEVESPLERHVREDGAAIEIRAFCAGGVWSGSGVLIGGDRALTALHVAWPEKCRPAPLLHVSGVGFAATATIEARWTTRDVARIRLSSPTSVPAPRLGEVIVGDALCSASAVPERAHHCGLVEDGVASIGGGSRQRWGARVELGNSGSGVYDSGGRLVGIVTNGRFDGGQPAGVAWFAPVAAEMLR